MSSPPAHHDPREVTFPTLAAVGRPEPRLQDREESAWLPSQTAPCPSPLAPPTIPVEDEEKGDELRADIEYDSLPTFPLRPSFATAPLPPRYETKCASFDPCPDDPHHPSSMPIYQTATFLQPSIEEFGPYDYTRSGNPTRTALESQVALLEGAHAAFAFNSGMAALKAVCGLVEEREEILCGDDIYGGMHRLLTKVVGKMGIKVRFVDMSNLDEFEKKISDRTRLVHCESPSNPLMRITDLRKLAAMLKKKGILLSVDSTMMSPYLMQPLRLGADLAVHSATKFLMGHSDTMGGVVCVASDFLAKKIAFLQNAEGSACPPFDCWLALRGIKTLCIRQDRANENAVKIAQFLGSHPLVRKLHFAGWCAPDASKAEQEALKTHMGQARSGGSVISFETGSVRFSRRICDGTKLFKISVSFGSTSSVIEMPCVLSHASIPPEMRTLPEDLVRISVGIEHWEDLLEDLRAAFRSALSGTCKKKVLTKEEEEMPSSVGA